MGNLYETLEDEFDKLSESIKQKLIDGRIGFGDLSALIREFLDSAVIIAEQLKAPGKDKKAVVIEALLKFWDSPIIQNLDIPGPDALIKPMIRGALPFFAGILIDLIVKLYNSQIGGWPTV